MRGGAMILVIIAHSFLLCDPAKLDSRFYSYFALGTGIASVTFMFTSGMTITYLMLARDDQPKVQRRFVKRGLFLLFVIHPVIRLVSYPFFSDTGDILHNMIRDYPITDTIGLCLITAPALVRTTGQAARIKLIIALLLLTLAVRLWWHPGPGFGEIVKIALFGPVTNAASGLIVAFPLAPWLAIYLCGSMSGEIFYTIKQRLISPQDAAMQLMRSGWRLLPIGIALAVLYIALKKLNPFGWSSETLLILYPSRTTFLLPWYLGLIHLACAYLIRNVDGRGRYHRVYWGMSIFGRNSLFTFVLQFALVWSIPALLGLKGAAGYPEFVTIIIAATIISWVLAYGYGRIRNRVVANDYAQLRRT